MSDDIVYYYHEYIRYRSDDEKANALVEKIDDAKHIISNATKDLKAHVAQTCTHSWRYYDDNYRTCRYCQKTEA